MTELGPLRPGFGERRRTRRMQVVRRAAWVLSFVVVFGVGVALGEALHDNPRPGGSRTRIHTVTPVPVGRPRETVTLTVTRP